MYELTAPPQMSSPYTPAGGSNIPTAPSLGSPVPGTTGGLPAQQGLSVTQNPAAKQLQSMGRGNDSMLIHMTPEEVNSLQGLAVASGGSLTTNPQTGLPEAGWLGKLLPTLLGGVLAATGVGAPLAAGIVGLGQTALTGDLSKGLMAGLGAFGGASLAGAAGLGGELSKNALGALGDKAGIFGANMGAGAVPASNAVIGSATGMGKVTAPIFGGSITPATAVPEALISNAGKAGAGGTGFFSKFGEAASRGLPQGMISKAAPMLAASGVMGGVSSAMTPDMPKYDPDKEKSNYKGPYVPSPRQVSYPNRQYDPQNVDSSEHMYFTPSNPVPGYRPVSELTQEERGEYGFAKGGTATPAGFDNLVSYFQSTSPGPITASMYPTQSAAPAGERAYTPNAGTPSTGEQTHKFENTSTGTGAGTGMGSGFAGGIINIPGVGPIDLSKIMTQYASTTPASSTVPTSNGVPYYGGGRAQRYPTKLVAAGGKVDMDDGSFVMDARTVSELGNGSSNAGMELLSRMGGRPVNGPGDGVSDSVPARIGGKQEARVARDEVIFSSDAVRRVGSGDEKRGTQKLYSLMNKAHKARKRAGRGTDTHLRKGLA